MLEAKVNNMPKDPRKYVVAKVVENELWYWMSFDTEPLADIAAAECGENAIVLENME